MSTYGYARVSTNGQDLTSQEHELLAAGYAKVFKEKVSGAKTDRAELAKLLGRIESGDVLVVTRLDRLARSTRDLLNVIAALTERGAGFKSLKDTWADTTSPHGRLMLTVLGGLAEFERELIRARTGEGRKRAKANGVKFGRPAALTPHQRQEAIQKLASGEAQWTSHELSMSVRRRSRGLGSGRSDESEASSRGRCAADAARGRSRGRFLQHVLRHLRRVSVVQYSVSVKQWVS